MRFKIMIEVEGNTVPKDNKRMIISLFKKGFELSNQSYYEAQYHLESNKMKTFTFGTYFRNPKFMKDSIELSDPMFSVTYSCYDPADGLNFYNAMVQMTNKPFEYRATTLFVRDIRMVKESVITSDEEVFKIVSPVVVREHHGDNKKTWYHDLNSEEGQKIFKTNLIFQLKEQFGDDNQADFEKVEIEVLQGKMTKVKHYEIAIPSNLGIIKMKAKPYILDYILKAGVGSNRSRGFGLLELVR